MPEQNIQISPDQIVFSFLVVLIAVAILVAFFFIVVISYFKANARRQSELLKAMIETQEKERNRIALDMHDDLGPLLSAVKLQVSSLRNSINQSSTSTLTETQEMLDSAIQQIRGIIRDLVPKNIDQKGLQGVLQDMKMHLETITPIRIDLKMDGLGERLPMQSEINIYRIIQEVLNNTLKHAGASNISVLVENLKDELNLIIADNGGGFDVKRSFDGSGLKNIDTRVQMNRGKYHVTSDAESGTRYFITFEKKYLH